MQQSNEHTDGNDVAPSLIDRMGDEDLSPAQKYQDMFVGSRSIWELAKYELLISLFSHLPGALGLFLRKQGYASMMRNVGSSTVFGQGMKVRCPSRIALGDNVIIDDNVVLDAKGDSSISRISLGDDVLVGRNGILSCTDAWIEIGDHVSMGPNCYLTTKKSIKVGSGVSIGPYTALIGAGHSVSDPEASVLEQERTAEGVTVEDGAWLGARSTILDGVRVGKNSVVGAGAVVTDDVPDQTVAAGVPAEIVKERS